MLSVIIPAYNEESAVPIITKELFRVLDREKISCELVFVDDGSNDNTWEAITNASTHDTRVHGIRFTRNFGKEAALFAGLSFAIGDCCITLDCDLQHPPEKIVEMYHLWQDGYDVIEGVKSSRGHETKVHRFCTTVFYSIMSHILGYDMKNHSDFKLLSRQATNALLSLHEVNTFYRALSSWVGFRTTKVSFNVYPRKTGKTKWNFVKLVRYAVQNITSFSTFPLRIITFLGILMLLFSIILGIQTVYNKIGGNAAEGFSTVIIVILFTGSLIMISLGIIGLYLSRIFDEVKARPRYIIADTIGVSNDTTDK